MTKESKNRKSEIKKKKKPNSKKRGVKGEKKEENK